MDYNEPAPPKSNTGMILGIVFGVGFFLFCCCGGAAWWGFRSASGAITEAGGAFAEMNRIGMAITMRYSVQASMGLNVQSTNGVSTRTWNIAMSPSAFDALPPDAKHAQALEIAAFARANVGAATPPTHICVTFGQGVQDCNAYEDLANVPIPPAPTTAVPAPAVPEPPVAPAVAPTEPAAPKP